MLCALEGCPGMNETTFWVRRCNGTVLRRQTMEQTSKFLIYFGNKAFLSTAYSFTNPPIKKKEQIKDNTFDSTFSWLYIIIHRTGYIPLQSPGVKGAQFEKHWTRQALCRGDIRCPLSVKCPVPWQLLRVMGPVWPMGCRWKWCVNSKHRHRDRHCISLFPWHCDRGALRPQEGRALISLGPWASERTRVLSHSALLMVWARDTGVHCHSRNKAPYTISEMKSSFFYAFSPLFSDPILFAGVPASRALHASSRGWLGSTNMPFW